MPLRRSILSRTFWRSFRDQEEALAAMAVADSEESSPPPPPISQESDIVGSWSAMLPELLGEIIRRVADREDQWPQRRDVVTCACVSKKWRDITREIIGPQCNSGKITFPSCLKLPGPQDFPNQCLIRRNKKTSTFYLHLTPSFTDKGKFLLAARRFRTGAYTEYIISLDADDFSQGSNAYVGKLRSDFLGINFTIYDSQPPHSGAKPSSSKASRRFASNQISPQVSSGNFEVGNVAYKRFKAIGARRIVCSLKCPISSPSSSGDASPNQKRTDEAKMKKPDGNASGLTILKNIAPMWNEHLQCWGLEFHGRVTVASVKNFQLVATMDDESQPRLQFGKVGDDTFTMDYRQPLSAFQAFAIGLASFGTKFFLPVKK